MLSGKTVKIRRDGKYGNTVIDYKDTLPKDLAPLIIADASGRVRETYRQMAKGRENLVFLKTAPKRYDNLTIHVWQRGGGKAAFQVPGNKLVEGMAETISPIPTRSGWSSLTSRTRIGNVAGA